MRVNATEECSELSHNNSFIYKEIKKPSSVIPSGVLRLNENNAPGMPSDNLQLLLRVHEVAISVPPSINLIIACVCNDLKYETPKRRKVDIATKTVNFDD